ncbi:hypothetical protein 2017DRC106_0825 [Vibrio phage ICP1]|nr:hypothetical protein 2017DRC106_0825 [Vibrio phage ICP1]
MISQKYIDREKLIWKLMCTNDEGDDNSHKVISYFVKKSRGQTIDITGKVYQPKKVEFVKLVNSAWALAQWDDVIHTKKGDIRKKYVDKVLSMSDTYLALGHYLEQVRCEGTKNALLSWQEFYLLKGE